MTDALEDHRELIEEVAGIDEAKTAKYADELLDQIDS